MSKLEVIKDTLNARIKSGELTQEDAQKVFEVACEKHPEDALKMMTEDANEENEETKVESEDNMTLEETIDYIQNYLTEAAGTNLSEDVVNAKRLLEAPQKSTNANAAGEVAKNNASSKRELSAASEEIKPDYKKAEGINESEEDLENELNKLRCEVYESYDRGEIDKETKESFLWNLDLNNYKIEE